MWKKFWLWACHTDDSVFVSLRDGGGVPPGEFYAVPDYFISNGQTQAEVEATCGLVFSGSFTNFTLNWKLSEGDLPPKFLEILGGTWLRTEGWELF